MRGRRWRDELLAISHPAYGAREDCSQPTTIAFLELKGRVSTARNEVETCLGCQICRRHDPSLLRRRSWSHRCGETQIHYLVDLA